ncbi:MAG: chromate transporter, partial [Bdellovibrionaceae bacterium]|nr:chromate transporter [Pseudobdellovibrionaceae bacterium]
MSPGLLEVIRYFLTLGFTGFGGPLAILGYMQRDLIHKRRWMSETEFLQILPLIKSMPGPVAFQMAVFLGRHRAGFWGGLWAGLGLVLPSFFMMLLLAELSLKFSGVSELNLLMSGLQGAAISLIIVALGTIARPHSGHFDFWLWSLVAGVIFYFRAVPEPILILGAGFLSALLGGRKKTSLPSLMFALPMTEDLLRLFWICFKAGAFVFGSGLAIVPFLEGDFVIETEWVSRKEFMNAIAFGQMTTGPVVITVTYLGYK